MSAGWTEDKMKSRLQIGVVGPCAAGKTTLIEGLNTYGWQARQLSQEHSFVPDMWRRLNAPALLIFLDVSYQNTLIRQNLNWTPEEYDEQQRRLQHARRHTDLYLSTDNLKPEEVLSKVLSFLNSHLLTDEG